MLPSLFYKNYSPLAFDSSWREFDQLFDMPSVASPAYEVEDTESHYLISVDLPGVPKDKIQVDAEGDRLSIRGERGNRKLAVAFSLPKDATREDLEATFEDGVLKVAIAKEESSKPRRIEIKEGKTGVFSKLLGGDKKEATA